MEPTKLETKKKTNMGGDQPSFTTPPSDVADDKEREKRSLAYQISPVASRSDRLVAASKEDRRRVESMSRGNKLRNDSDTPNKALVQAALLSSRWPPHVVCVWATALLLSHALHAAAAILQTALPPVKRLSSYLLQWTRAAWLDDDNARIYPMFLGAITFAAYTLYYLLYAAYSIVVWSIEPARPEVEEEAVVTEYEELDGEKVDNK